VLDFQIVIDNYEYFLLIADIKFKGFKNFPRFGKWIDNK